MINVVKVVGKNKYQVLISWREDAEQKDLIESYYYASKLSNWIEIESSNQTIAKEKLKELLKTTKLDDSEYSQFVKQMKDVGWDTKYTFLEISPKRYIIESVPKN